MPPPGIQMQTQPQPGVPIRCSSLSRTTASTTNPGPCNTLMNTGCPPQNKNDVPSEFLAPLNPVSRIQIGQQEPSFNLGSPSENSSALEQQNIASLRLSKQHPNQMVAEMEANQQLNYHYVFYHDIFYILEANYKYYSYENQ